MAVAIVAALAVLAPVAPAIAAARTAAVIYHGYRVVVPAGWPVFNLATAPTTCVRFNRHAVYLGTPGSDQRCLTPAAGRTEAILVSPLAARGRMALPATAARAGPRSELRLTLPVESVEVTATWGRHPSVIRRALGLRSLAPAARATSARRPPSQVGFARTLARAVAHARHSARSERAAAGRMHGAAGQMHTAARSHAVGGPVPAPPAPATPGAVYTGPGFDACSTPSTATMNAWGASPYRAIGVYIGGANMACSQPNLNATWVAQESATGWHLVPIYVGLQAPSNTCGCAGISKVSATAGAQGAAAAQDAVTDAQATGVGPGNPLYLDMEGYNRTTSNTASVLAFVAGWTTQLHAEGYGSGVYSSSDSGIVDLVSQYGTSYPEPDELWIASWNGQENTDDPNVPATEWASHQRLHQYRGAHNETYQHATISIDGDYVDAPTAAAGNGPGIAPAPAPAPSLSISSGPDGSVRLT
ncbi:MAG: DUF1906 domain-containing protein, partial [Solirubrobacteraceae bacterium]